MNTYDLQRAIRDDSSLNAGEVAVLFVLSTYLPHAAPSVAAIAQGCRMTAKSVRHVKVYVGTEALALLDDVINNIAAEGGR